MEDKLIDVAEQDIEVYKILCLTPRFSFIKPGTFLGSFGWFWKITTQVYPQEIKEKTLKPAEKKPGEKWIYCLYDIVPELVRTKDLWEDLYVTGFSPCFTVTATIPKRTHYKTGTIHRGAGFLGISAERIVLGDKVVNYSKGIGDMERLIIKRKLESWK